ncbi:lysine--tRNA ligase [Gammaproteobacteria bacterium]|nr:lysine--tRNA ligase [Gammaproteobacteria bacterium]
MSNIDPYQVRREKLESLRANAQAYPNHLKPTHTIQSVLDVNADVTGVDENLVYEVCGRIITSRVMGKAAFLTILDGSNHIQVYLRANDLGLDVFASVKTWDLGDIIHVKGHVFYTKMGEVTIWSSESTLLVKALRPLPDKFHGLADTEVKYRQRYLDLISNPDSKAVFKKRIQLVELLRQFFVERGFLEVETPMMHTIAGGAVARPFETHHNALDIPLYLRIAPELYLKRLVVGGFDRVFEINRNFRNEGLSTRHNPEFTMIEFYQAYADYRDLMQLTQVLFNQIATVFGDKVVYQGQEIDFKSSILEMTMQDAILKVHPSLTLECLDRFEKLQAYLVSQELSVPQTEYVEDLQLHLFEETVEQTLIQPTFITNYPARTSPLARPSDSDPRYAERFELFIAGQEIANGFSELNDPDIQAQRFQEQVERKQQGDHEAMLFDHEYITALEHGLPPTAGQGFGVDRLVMILTGVSSIRDVILFPTLRPLKQDGADS